MGSIFSAIKPFFFVRAGLLILFGISMAATANAQTDCSASQNPDSICISPNIRNYRIGWMASAVAISVPASIVGLNFAWHGKLPNQRFHLTKEDNGWLQMPKGSYFLGGSKVAINSYYVFNWTGVNRKKNIWYAGIGSAVYMTMLETADGFTPSGFSFTDWGMGVAGAAFTTAQLLKWREQKVNLKYSVHKSPYAKYNPETLGTNRAQQWLKDYNGQTYWVSFSPWAWSKSTKAPRWLCIAFGYGADGMLAAYNNNVPGDPPPTFTRYRQYYISLDIDLSKVKTRYKLVHFLFLALSNIKVPFPAFEFNSKEGLRFHPIYF